MFRNGCSRSRWGKSNIWRLNPPTSDILGRWREPLPDEPTLRAAGFSEATSVRKRSDFAHPCPYFLLAVAFPESSR
jgi:hypothetical protein